MNTDLGCVYSGWGGWRVFFELDKDSDNLASEGSLGFLYDERGKPPVEADGDQHDNGPLREDCGQTVGGDEPPGVPVEPYLVHDPPNHQTNTFYGGYNPARKSSRCSREFKVQQGERNERKINTE